MLAGVGFFTNWFVRGFRGQTSQSKQGRMEHSVRTVAGKTLTRICLDCLEFLVCFLCLSFQLCLSHRALNPRTPAGPGVCRRAAAIVGRWRRHFQQRYACMSMHRKRVSDSVKCIFKRTRSCVLKENNFWLHRNLLTCAYMKPHAFHIYSWPAWLYESTGSAKCDINHSPHTHVLLLLFSKGEGRREGRQCCHGAREIRTRCQGDLDKDTWCLCRIGRSRAYSQLVVC